jgi:hypothetical protein
MSRTLCFVLVAAGLAFCFVSGQVGADTLMLDQFYDNAAGCTLNENIGSPRQTGTMVPTGGITYTTTKTGVGTPLWGASWDSDPDIGKAFVYDTTGTEGRAAWQDQNWSALAGTDYAAHVLVKFMNPGTQTPTSPRSSAGFVAVSGTKDSACPTGTGAYGSIDSLGNWALYLGGSQAASGTTTEPGGDGSCDLNLVVKETGSAAQAWLVLGTQTLGSGSFTWGDSNRYIGMGHVAGASSTMCFDNLSLVNGADIPTVTPEPGSMTILICAVVGLLAYAWRKRK